MTRYVRYIAPSYQGSHEVHLHDGIVSLRGCEVDFRFIVPPGRPGGSVGRAVPGGSGGSVGVGNWVGGLRGHDLRRSPTLEISSQAVRTGSVGRTDPGAVSESAPRGRDGRGGRSVGDDESMQDHESHEYW